MGFEFSHLKAPSLATSASLDLAAHRSFLTDVVIDHGPRGLLARLFLKADRDLRARGIFLSFAGFDELVAANKANTASWAPLVPLFDPSVAAIDPATSFAMLGCNAAGEVVCSTAGRLYDLAGTTLKAEVESLRFFYRDPKDARAPGEIASITAPSAVSMSGRSVYVGATWYRPDYRKCGVMPVLSTLTRAIPMTRWRCDRVFSFMSRALIAAGVPARCHCPHVERDVTLINSPVAPGSVYRGALIWGEEADLLRALANFVGDPASRDRRRRPH